MNLWLGTQKMEESNDPKSDYDFSLSAFGVSSFSFMNNRLTK